MEETSWGDSEHRWIKPGQLFTKGPGTYKIPSFNDVPADMRVKLMDRANAFAVHSSKARKTTTPPPAARENVVQSQHVTLRRTQRQQWCWGFVVVRSSRG